jgi:hypothetical protein
MSIIGVLFLQGYWCLFRFLRKQELQIKHPTELISICFQFNKSQVRRRCCMHSFRQTKVLPQSIFDDIPKRQQFSFLTYLLTELGPS